MGRGTTKSLIALVAAVGLTGTAAGPVVAQDKDPDPSRVAEILFYTEVRAIGEADVAFEEGDYPKIIQQQRIRYELRPWDEMLASDLIWMLGNIEYEGERVARALKFIEDSPELVDRGLPAAQVFWQRQMFARIPAVLEPDLNREPPPHRTVFTLLSSAYRRMGYDRDVIRVIDVALKHFPDDPALLRNRASAELRLRGGKTD